MKKTTGGPPAALTLNAERWTNDNRSKRAVEVVTPSGFAAVRTLQNFCAPCNSFWGREGDKDRGTPVHAMQAEDQRPWLLITYKYTYLRGPACWR